MRWGPQGGTEWILQLSPYWSTRHGVLFSDTLNFEFGQAITCFAGGDSCKLTPCYHLFMYFIDCYCSNSHCIAFKTFKNPKHCSEMIWRSINFNRLTIYNIRRLPTFQCENSVWLHLYWRVVIVDECVRQLQMSLLSHLLKHHTESPNQPAGNTPIEPLNRNQWNQYMRSHQMWCVWALFLLCCPSVYLC